MISPKPQAPSPKPRGFTLIELLIAITLIAVIMIPISMIMAEYARSIAYADSLATTTNLACRELGVINNLNYSDPTLADGYDHTTPDYDGYKFDLRRVVNYVAGTNNNLKRVRVMMSPSGSAEQLIEVDTYAMNIRFATGSAGGALGNEVDYFVVSGGNLGRSSLTQVTLQNTRATGNLTITGLIMTSTINKTVTSITMGGDIVQSTSVTLPANTPVTIDLQKNFFMNSGTTYSGANGGRFQLSATPPSQHYSVSIIFIFFDGTQSILYSWSY